MLQFSELNVKSTRSHQWLCSFCAAETFDQTKQESLMNVTATVTVTVSAGRLVVVWKSNLANMTKDFLFQDYVKSTVWRMSNSEWI